MERAYTATELLAEVKLIEDRVGAKNSVMILLSHDEATVMVYESRQAMKSHHFCGKTFEEVFVKTWIGLDTIVFETDAYLILGIDPPRDMARGA